MLAFRSSAELWLRTAPSRRQVSPCCFIRHASLTSAIDRGRRRETNGTIRAPASRLLDRQATAAEELSQGGRRSPPDIPGRLQRKPRERDNFDSFSSRSESAAPRRPDGSDRYPISVPYSAADSQFIYGFSAVVNALQSMRRRLYKLYVAQRDPDWLQAYSKPSKRQRMLNAYNGEMREIARLAKAAHVEVVRLQDSSQHRLLDKMSSGRPHNGYVLEASPLPAWSATGLAEVEMAGEAVFKLLGKTEPLQAVPMCQPGTRFPVVLFLDSVTDSGNLGNMIRTAFFLGVDAMVLNDSCCPLSPVVLKAAAGAAERMLFIKVSKGAAFIENSQAAGWKVVAAVPPPDGGANRRIAATQRFDLAKLRDSRLLDSVPVVLLIGSEGDGLKHALESRADYTVGIQSVRRATLDQPRGTSAAEIDSLNVTVAASLLMEALLSPSTPRAADEADASSDAGNKLWFDNVVKDSGNKPEPDV